MEQYSADGIVTTVVGGYQTHRDKMMSEKVDMLATALSKAQLEMKGAERDAENPFFKRSYSTLLSVRSACVEALSKYGLSVTQTTRIESDKTILVTMLMHSSGQWLKGEYPVTPAKQDPQGLKSALTYARRATLESITGVASSDDDDGNAASSGTPNVPKIFSTPMNSSEAGKYVITFGKKYKGKSFDEIGQQDLSSYITYFQSTLSKDNKQPTPEIQAFFDAADIYFGDS